MNTALDLYLHTLGLGAALNTRRLTQEDIAVAFGGRDSALSQALRGVEVTGSAPMLHSISMAARALRGELGEVEREALPNTWRRARAGLRRLEEQLPTDDPRAERMRAWL